MAKSKYGKYIIKKPQSWVAPGDGQEKRPAPEQRTQILYMDSTFIKEAPFFTVCNWTWSNTNLTPSTPHTHNFDELYAFVGSNPERTSDLCGEIEIWLGDEKHILTETCLVFIPKGLQHGPVVYRRVDRPIFNFVTGVMPSYSLKNNLNSP
jgi:hypothetical protein